jgi:hypothetical protein
MNMKNLISFAILLLIGCQESRHEITTLCKLPKNLHEVSGMQPAEGGTKIYVIEDSGNGSLLTEIGFDGSTLKEYTIEVENVDWEDLTSGRNGDLYLGDFGNNDNDRKDLAIYKIDLSSKAETIMPSYKISFYYPEQTKFPPSKKSLLYDCEAFFELNGSFYLFTKNRSKGFDGTTLIYKVPNQAGSHPAQLLGSYKTGKDYNTSAVTGAAISPDRSKFVLLGHGKVWLFENFKEDRFLDGTITELDLHHYTKKEAVCFKDNNTLWIADEKDKKTGGNVYEVSLENLKSKS